MNGEKDFDFANFIGTNCINAIDTNGFYSNCATSNGTITIIVNAYWLDEPSNHFTKVLYLIFHTRKRAKGERANG